MSDGVKATSKEGSKMFKDQIKATINKVIEEGNKINDIQIMYLDKNYPPMEIKISL